MKTAVVRAGLGLTLALGGCTANGGAEEAPDNTPAAISAHAVYYQPRTGDLHDRQSLVLPAGVFTMVAEPGQPNSWTSATRCSPANANNFLDVLGVQEARIVAGFSLGRIGLAYLLQTTPAEQRPNIRRLVAVDPGNAEDFTDSCDPTNTTALIASWLAEHPENKFVVYAGQRTAEDDYAGIRRNYLTAVAGTAVASQLVVCNTGLGHEPSWNQVKTGLFAPDAFASQDCLPGTNPAVITIT